MKVVSCNELMMMKGLRTTICTYMYLAFVAHEEGDGLLGVEGLLKRSYGLVGRRENICIYI